MNYQIFLRIRQSEYSHPFFKVEEQQLVLKAPGTKQIDKFIFDDIFDINSNSEEIVKKIGFAQLDKVILSYGQSGSGKSFTLFGSEEQPGIMPLMLQQLLEEKYQVSINYKIIDKEMNSTFVTEDMTTINLYDVQTFWEYYKAFSKQSVGKNLVVELKINQTHKMQFVDLIGSQRMAKDVSEPQKYQDQIWISSQLQVLGKCLVSLAKNQTVPLAESKLTQCLNLTKNAQVILLGQIYPKSENYEETLLTVQFIDRTKNIILAPRKESIRSAEVTRTQLLEKQCKVLEYENKDLKQIIEKQKQDHSRKLKTLKDILCIDFDLDDLTCLSFKELQQFKKQQEAFVINVNLQQTIKDQEDKISKLNQQIKDLHQEYKIKQDKFQLQIIEQKHKNFKMNELMITTKATLSEQIRQVSQEKEVCIKSILENSNNLIDQTTNKLYNLPQAAQQKQLDNAKLVELRKQIKQEIESEQNKHLNQQKSDYETQINALKQQHEYLMKEKNNEIEQFILQLKKYREKKKNLIREMKEEMLSLFDIITRQQQLIEKIECGGYSGGIKQFNIPAKDKPLMPIQLKFKHLFHFVDRKPPEITNTALKKSFSVEKKLVITPVNRINRSQTTFQEQPVVFDPVDIDQINHNQMDMTSLKSFVLKLKEMLKKEKDDNSQKQEQLKQQIVAIQKGIYFHHNKRKKNWSLNTIKRAENTINKKWLQNPKIDCSLKLDLQVLYRENSLDDIVTNLISLSNDLSNILIYKLFNMDKYEMLVKVVIIGDTSVGKTNIMTQYCDTNFKANLPATIGADSRVKLIEMNERETIKMMIWDTCGQERFKSITKNTFKGAQGFVLVYDITSKQSFEHVEDWLESIKDNIDTSTVSIVLVGNKLDLDELRQVSPDHGQAVANKHNLQFFETSAKQGTNVSDVFVSLARNIRKIVSTQTKDTEMLNTDDTKKKKKGCC